jgi:hypothetical protein
MCRYLQADQGPHECYASPLKVDVMGVDVA